MKRKICFVITSNVHYSRSQLLLKTLQARPDVELQIVVAGSAILPQYGDVLELMQKDGLEATAKILMVMEGGTSVAMAKTAGIALTEFTTVLENLKPDLTVVRGDRYEVLSAVIASAYLNIPVAHLEGGEVSGSIDESVRHSITKLSHLHFVTNELAKSRLLRMGENPRYVFNFGCPELEILTKIEFQKPQALVNFLGVGEHLDLQKPYLVIMQHPVTSEVGKNRDYIEQTLMAIVELGISAVWFWPNVDAGTDEVSKGIRVFREKQNPQNIRFVKYLPPKDFLGLLQGCLCLVGNSSAGIKECSFLGVPAVNIGTRQNGRLRAENVIDVGYNKEEIKQAIEKQVAHGQYPQSRIYFGENVAEKIAQVLSTVPLYTQKQFFD